MVCNAFSGIVPSQLASQPAILLIRISDVQCLYFRIEFNVDHACLKEVLAVPCVL